MQATALEQTIEYTKYASILVNFEDQLGNLLLHPGPCAEDCTDVKLFTKGLQYLEKVAFDKACMHAYCGMACVLFVSDCLLSSVQFSSYCLSFVQFKCC